MKLHDIQLLKRIAVSAIAAIALTGCQPKKVIVPAPYTVQSQGRNHLVRLEPQQPLSQLLVDLGCGPSLCTVAEANLTTIEVRRQIVMVLTPTEHSAKAFQGLLGCGPQFLCSTDGHSTTILKRKLKEE